ncbi:MAG: J domain-containing protein [Phycisphaeraceae bacterium]|nr:J domain-containing protein [Phycisphaeraceae bacterium]
MAVKFQDYYQTLGVSRTATAAEIQRAYRKLARQFHPDVNKSADAAEKFAQINEAYEVLKDPEKRKRFDELGPNWKAGQEFRPPPEWGNFHFGGAGGRGRGQRGGQQGGFSFEPGGFSDFFEMLFGQAARGQRGNGGARMQGFEDMFEQMHAGDEAMREAPAQEADLAITLDEAFRGSSRQLRLSMPDGQTRTLEVKVPQGVRDGQKIRLRGQAGGGADLILRVKIADDPRFERDGADLITDLRLSPWEAALGAKVPVESIDGTVEVTVPPGSSSGQKLRLRGRGIPSGPDQRGDLLVRLKIVLPKTLSDEERELFEQLRKTSKFDPRV